MGREIMLRCLMEDDPKVRNLPIAALLTTNL
jgi:hypothetical protein